MKKMKKSLVVVPALARIARTTVASVSGTVAWFTANRAVTINASNFQAKAESGALSVISKDLVGVIADEANENKGSVKMDTNNYLTDGSFDFIELYTKDTLDDDGNPLTYKSLGNYASAKGNSTNWKITSDGNTLWYGVSWTWEFTYKFSTLDSDRALFFNIKDSAFAFTSLAENVDGAEHVSTNEVGKGFRLARTTDEKKIVWAPTGATNKHVGKNDSSSIVADQTFAADEWHLNGETPEGGQAQDVTTTGTTNNYISAQKNAYCYLGKFAAPAAAGNVTLSVVCTAWFEGTDTNVVNDALSQIVTTTQKFFVRKTPKASA